MNNPNEPIIFDPATALSTRLSAYTAGACFALDNMELDQDSLDTVKSALETALRDKLTEIQAQTIETANYHIIVGEFIENLHALSQPHLSVKDISLGAAYWTWQNHRRESIVSDVNTENVHMHIEESALVPTMSVQQQTVLSAIHSPSPPTWFTQLKPWEQTYLKKITPPEATNWSAFEKVLPSTLRRFPGLANATKKTTTTTDRLGKTHTNTSYRQGIPTAFDMPTEDYQSSAQSNLRQMLDAIQTDVQTNFQNFWELEDDTTIKAPVVMLGLLTHRKDANLFGIAGSYLGFGGQEDNTKRTDEKTEAIGAVASEYSRLQLIDLNIGVNWFRGHFLGAHVDDYIQTMDDFLTSIRTQIPEMAQQKWTHAKWSLENLRTHNDKGLVKGRNKNLFTAALCHYVANQCGGSVIPNCKSAKDRTAQELIMADAIDLYYTQYGQLPEYDADVQDRANFVALFVEIYKTRHHQAVANDNSPGSLGIKDENMLDQDIVSALNADSSGPLHAQSKHLAKLNKAEDLSLLYKAFRALMYLGMLLGSPLVALWQCICSKASSDKTNEAAITYHQLPQNESAASDADSQGSNPEDRFNSKF